MKVRDILKLFPIFAIVYLIRTDVWLASLWKISLIFHLDDSTAKRPFYHGAILGLILIHDLWDLETVLIVASSNSEINSRRLPEIPLPGWMALGLVLMLLPPVYLWLIYPLTKRNHISLKVVC